MKSNLLQSRIFLENMFIAKPQNNPLQWRLFFFLLLFVSHLLHSSHGDVGTASRYAPPYSPTACFGSDLSQFPTSNLFGAAGDGIWENGAACGRQYFVRCFSASDPEACVPNQTVQITIVDYAPDIVSVPTAAGTTMILSTTAYNAVVNTSATVKFVTIEFLQKVEGKMPPINQLSFISKSQKMSTVLLSFRPIGIRPSACDSAGHRKQPYPGCHCRPWSRPGPSDYTIDDGAESKRQSLDSDSTEKAAECRFSPGCFMAEKARQLRIMTAKADSHHDAMYHSAIEICIYK